MKIRVIHCLPRVFNIDDMIKIWNTTWNKGLSHYYSNKKVKFRQTKIETKKFVVEWWRHLDEVAFNTNDEFIFNTTMNDKGIFNTIKSASSDYL